ncbi:MAG: RNase III inhibitor [Firmicutes bacterium GWF2_51_9]|nr:MAG: RNase III inhibitor [Firmicutes bacterium GWF2_51_9]OGS59426.1 MAG: RNase III inhibitor [Firmicutes bacterium GWE2_51_13]HAM62762.1 RNase III inhibitor [Erysipelotrichaceae bacterium]
MPFQIIRNDITKMEVDVIVNAANSRLMMGGGVCGAIFSAAGADVLQEECNRIGHCEPGESVITKGHALPAKYIIHTVGPIWQGGRRREAEILRNCYINSLELARSKNLKSIAFPLISSGIYGYPKEKALEVAISAIGSYLLKHEMDVTLVVYDNLSFVISKKTFDAVERFIDDHYVDEKLELERSDLYLKIHQSESSDVLYSLNDIQRNTLDQEVEIPRRRRKLEDVLDEIEESFTEHLFRLIDERGMKDSDVYRRANMDRRLFSKIRNGRVNPSKTSCLSLALGLKLNLDETKDFLARAGYALSPSNKMDLVVRYFIENNNHNIFEINSVLFGKNLPILGS